MNMGHERSWGANEFGARMNLGERFTFLRTGAKRDADARVPAQTPLQSTQHAEAGAKPEPSTPSPMPGAALPPRMVRDAHLADGVTSVIMDESAPSQGAMSQVLLTPPMRPTAAANAQKLGNPAREPGKIEAPMPSPHHQASTLQTPVFIVGSPRSGTSILTAGLLSAGYNGYREGNFLTLLRQFENLADRHKATYGQATDMVLAGRVDWEAFKNDLFDVFKHHIDTLNPAAPWMDKTGNPEMIEAIPQLLKLWPSAVFIFAKRRAIENVLSRMKKFPGHTFEYHCRDWARNMAAWRAIRHKPGVRYIEIDQQEIIRDPQDVAAKLSDFLQAGPEARGRVQKTFASDRPQQTSEGSAAHVATLETVGWTAQQRDIFLRLCWPEMEQFNYSATDSYWAAKAMPEQYSAVS